LSDGREYLVGNRITLADIVVYIVNIRPLKYNITPEFRATQPKADAYIKKISEIPQVKKFCGELVYCEKEAEPNSVKL
jgi:elongation factor 1-gamma